MLLKMRKEICMRVRVCLCMCIGKNEIEHYRGRDGTERQREPEF